MTKEEAIKRIRDWHLDDDDMEVLSAAIPELKESEDEKIRHAICGALQNTLSMNYLQSLGVTLKESLAWLEKQCEKTNPYSGISFEYNGHIWGMCARDNGVDILMDKQLFKHLDEKQGERVTDKIIERIITEKQKVLITETNGDAHIDWNCRNLQDVKLLLKYGLEYIDKQLKKQGEQTSTDKTEPKFKVGDWVVWGNKISCYIESIYQDKESFASMYTFTDTYNRTSSHNVKDFDNYAHLWTVQDAKDGDVLANNGNIILFKEISNSARKDYKYIKSHCLLLVTASVFYTGGSYNLDDGFHPATEEQHDLLFSKMKEAGYEWDAEDKVLKKIEQKSAWSDDERIRIGLICHLKELRDWKYGEPVPIKISSHYDAWLDWLKKQGKQKLRQCV